MDEKLVNKMVEVIKTISEQSKDNPKLVESFFGKVIVMECNEIINQLKK